MLDARRVVDVGDVVTLAETSIVREEMRGFDSRALRRTRVAAPTAYDNERSRSRVKALVKESAGSGFALRDVPEPKIRENEVLIRVRRAGVCGTDVHIYEWDAWARGRCSPPFIVGHEFAGDVVQVGALVTDVREGDRVTAEGHIVDGRCLLCRTGNAHVCPYTKIIGVDRDGCFAEYIAMPATNVWHLDDNISFDIGGIHDPMGNAFHTALSADIPGATVLVTGCGPIGLFAIGICKAAGASRIIASDINETRLALASRMAAHDVVHPNEAATVVKRHTDGLGVDVVLEMSGSPAAINFGLDVVKMGGIISLLGLPAGHAVTIDDYTRNVIFKGVRLQGIIGRRMYGTWSRMLALLRGGLDVEWVVQATFDSLKDFHEGMGKFDRHEALKVVFFPEGESAANRRLSA